MWLLQSLLIYLCPSFLIFVNMTVFEELLSVYQTPMESNGVHQWMSAQRGRQERFTSERRWHWEVTACCSSHRHSGAGRLKCIMEAQGGQSRGTGAGRTSGGTGLWELGKTQPPLCSPRGCQGSGESQLSSIIRTMEGRKYRRDKYGSPATEEAWKKEAEEGEKRKEVVFVGPLRHLQGDRRDKRKSQSQVYGTQGRGRQTAQSI